VIGSSKAVAVCGLVVVAAAAAAAAAAPAAPAAVVKERKCRIISGKMRCISGSFFFDLVQVLFGNMRQ